MSRMNEMWYGSLAEARQHLESDTPTLEETQCALINAINHIEKLERQVERLEKNATGSYADHGRMTSL